MSAAVRIRLMLLLRRNQLGKASALEDSIDLQGQQLGAIHLDNTDLEKRAASGSTKVFVAEDSKDARSVSEESVNSGDKLSSDEVAFAEARDLAQEKNMKWLRIFALIIVFGALSICSIPAHAQQEVDPDHFDQPMVTTYSQVSRSTHSRNSTRAEHLVNSTLPIVHPERARQHQQPNEHQQRRSERTNQALLGMDLEPMRAQDNGDPRR
jgi:hypothetical protein